jgi:hypothetical protein
MLNTRKVGRLGMMAVGLGFGAAVAAATSSADPSDWTSSLGGIDDPVAALAAPSADNFAISIDGFTLVQEGSAHATSTFGGLAIADGANASASASGFFDTSVAGGAGADAVTTGNFDSANAFGVDAGATAGGSPTSYLDVATAAGTDSDAAAEYGAFDSASIYGQNNNATADFGNGDSASVTGSGDTAIAGGSTFGLLGNNDIATLVDGTNSTAEAGSNATDPGSFDYAGIFFQDAANLYAQGANFLFETLPHLF